MDKILAKMDKIFKKKVTYNTWSCYYDFFNLAIVSGIINIEYLNILASYLENAYVIIRNDNDYNSYLTGLKNITTLIKNLNVCNRKGR